jgi:ankyrin repeat protein
MGIIRKTYNFIMTLIGLIIFALIAYVFVVGKWEEHKEEQYVEEREEISEAVAEESRKRGIGDPGQLRLKYLGYCKDGPFTVREGNHAEICEAVADALLEQSQKKQITFTDQIEINYRLCAHNAEEYDEDPDDYCDRSEYAQDTLRDAMAMGLCALDSAWVFDTSYESQFTKRGPHVYADSDLRVDCGTRLFNEWDYVGFFEGLTEDEEGEPIVDQVYDLLENGENDRAMAALAKHEFGKDELTDQQLLNLFLWEPNDALLGEAIKVNGGQVNFNADYYNQPLSEAIDNQSAKAALVLLGAGADPLRPQDYGQAPIVLAASQGMLDVVKAMVAKGADVNGVLGSEAQDFGQPLLHSAWNGHGEVALWLLDNGATIAPDDPASYPVWEPGYLLDRAVVGGNAEVIRRIVAMGAKSKDLTRLYEGAAQGGNPAVVKLLIAEGYELPDVKNHDRIYDEVVDVIEEDEEKHRIEDGMAMFEIFLDQGLDLSLVRDSGWTYAHQAIIHYAPNIIDFRDSERVAFVRAQRVKFVKRVIDEAVESGVPIDQQHEGQTMLMAAADRGQAELAQYLLERGADASLRDGEGRTALDIAKMEGRRLSRVWDEKPEVAQHFGDVIEILGGDRAVLKEQS